MSIWKSVHVLYGMISEIMEISQNTETQRGKLLRFGYDNEVVKEVQNFDCVLEEKNKQGNVRKKFLGKCKHMFAY